MKLSKTQIDRLRELGYQYSPMALAAANEEELIKGMVWHWQANASDNIQKVMPLVHGPGRDLQVDGDAGPATIASLYHVRCGEPDYRPPEEAARRILGSVSEARWPVSCADALTWALHKDIDLKGLTRDQVMESFRKAFDVWHRNLKGVAFVEKHHDYEGSNFRETMADLGAGGTLARHIVGTNNGCNDSIWGQVNQRLNWKQEYLTTVLAHEIGHGMDFDHVNDNTALMNPYITQPAINRVWWDKPNSTDLAEAKRRGYTLQKTPPGDEPDDPDDPNVPVPPVPTKFTISIPAHVTVDGVSQAGTMRWVGDGTGNGWNVT